MQSRAWPGGLGKTVPGRHWSWPRREKLVQLGVFGLAVVVCLVLLGRHSRASSWVGLARGRIVQLSVPWAARVEAVPVELFQKVRGGDVIAILDHSVLAAQIEQVEAEVARLRSEHAENQSLLDADVGERRADWDDASRAFARDESELAIRLQEVEVDLRYDHAMLEGLRANVTILDNLVKKGHAAPTELELAQAEAEATASRGEANEKLAADLRARLEQAESRQVQHFDHRPVRPSRDTSLDHLRQAIAVQAGLLRQLEAQREQCILRSPFDGTIVEIRGRAGEESVRRPGEGDLRQPGEVVGAGEPVIAVAAERPTEVVVYVVGRASGGLREGLEVELTSQTARKVAVSAIESVGPTVERLPEVLWGDLQVPRWGRPFLVPIPPGFDVAAGDSVEVRLR